MSQANTRKKVMAPALTAAVVLIAIAVIAVGGTARSSNTISITVHNSTQRSIQRLYVATGDPDNWGPDQLNGSTIPSGGSHVLSSVACNGSAVRVIAEDQNGCFVYNNASCDANQTWDIPADATPDCGGGN